MKSRRGILNMKILVTGVGGQLGHDVMNELNKRGYNGTASAEGYALKDGTKLNLSDNDQKWVGVKDTFKF